MLAVLFLLSVAVHQTLAQQCYCIAGTSVNIRDAPCGNVIGSASTGQCYPQRGGSQTCTLSGVQYTFVEFEYGSVSGWAADDFVNVANCPTQTPEGVCSSLVESVSREAWGARPPNGITRLNTPVSHVFIHHSAGNECTDRASCINTVRAIQNFHMDSNGWSDIGYNWLVGGDGRAYEGRGFDIQGAHTGGSCNPISVAVCLMGDFHTTGSPPSDLIMSSARHIIDCGIQQGFISPWTVVRMQGHRDVCSTSCPGDYAFNIINTWQWYTSTDPCAC